MKKQLTSAVLALTLTFSFAAVAPTTTVEAASALTGNVYDFENVKTRDNTVIPELRGVAVGSIINLSRIEIGGQTITGWYLDADFTTPVTKEIFLDTGFITITESIIVNGLFPKFASDVSAVAPTTPGTTTGTPNDIITPVPSTGVAVLGQLF